MVLLISYDLNGHEQAVAYEKATAVIKRNAPDSIKPLFSQWLVNTQKTEQEWYEILAREVIDPNDRLLIVRVSRNAHIGWLDKAHVEWLDTRV